MLNRSKLLFVITLCSSGGAFAGQLYQWVDAEGVITYSPEPPPASVTKEFKEISKELSVTDIKKAEPAKTTRQPLMTKQRPKQEPIGLLENESKIERMARLAPKPAQRRQTKPVTPAKNLAPIDLEAIKHQRKCTDLVNRITALETRLSVVESAKQLNESMLLLARYQTMHENSCP